MSHGAKLTIKVSYPPTKDELKDHDAKRNEPLGALKQRVLAAFSLEEGVNERGELVEYVLFDHHRALTDPAQTVGHVAGDADELPLRLVRERHFFFYVERKIVSPTEQATGAEIKAMIKAVEPKFDTGQALILEGHGHQADKVVADGDVEVLEVDAHHPAKHFFSKPPTNFGGR
jgi:hypothetical protein